MARFYVADPQVENGLLKIGGREGRHLRSVLRLRSGDDLIVFDRAGREYEGTVVDEGTTSAVVRIRGIRPPEAESRVEIILAQSLLKGEKMDFLVQKATEIGVKAIAPFFSSRSVPLLGGAKRTERHHRWERIAVEACKQCGRRVVPEIEPLKDFEEMLDSPSPASLRLILWEGGGKALKEVIECSRERKEIFFIVGPEGGLSQEEVKLAEHKGFAPVKLRGRILRSETASLCLLSILRYETGGF